MYVLACLDHVSGSEDMMQAGLMPDAIHNKIEYRLCNAPNADPSLVCERLENARHTLDIKGRYNPEKTPLVSLLDHEIADAIKSSDLRIMQNALRAFNEYMEGPKPGEGTPVRSIYYDY